ncbi:MAG TPA: alanine--tRNA ligase [Cyclobacteriaceae bacterium]|nr:alanine--tRNA ligase [Cyclobacteriaceae bacterium]
MDSGTIRQKFLDFFEKRAHLIVPSAPLVLKNDPSLLFTNSGMVQFKDYFLGNSIPKSKRIADTQKCLRVSGKHNDLEDVGFDTYHHTMFEMLGNWSFGDYFKKEAIAWAWELLTEVYQLPKDRLYASVFGGDKEDNLPADTEALEYWKPIVGEDRIIYGTKKDNFWEMGDTGPCGPCSEIHIDLRPQEEVDKNPGKDLVNRDHPQVVEIWNLVFIQFNRLSSGQLENLPDKHVDTGMGFERLCMAIQGKKSNYDTDVFTPLIDFIAKEAKTEYGTNEKKDIAIRVIADHVRAVSFAISDGQLPSNTGAGYVIRRILRRAVRYAFSYLDFKEPFMHKLVPILADQLKAPFPELYNQKEFVVRVIIEEEQAFLRTLDKGLKRFENIKSELKGKTIDGELAFELYDTFGFPFDLTSLIAREKGLTVDEKGFLAEMEKQKARSKADAVKETGDWETVNEGSKPEFVGYENLSATTRLLRYRKVKQKNKELYQLVFERTPFYAESGGQVGDTGLIESDKEKIKVVDTKKENELIVHYTEKLPQKLDGIFNLKVDAHKRQLTMGNHSATHLMHAALREVLGTHVEQRGSLVNEKILRFDFSHFAPMTEQEISKVEDMVNKKIRENIPLNEKRNVPIEEAKGMGAMALFGEKYGDFVRVIAFDSNYSVELCGGTHVSATGQIGLFKIISESSVAAGVRRIEAMTAEGAERYLNNEIKLLQEVRSLLKNPKDLTAATKSLVEEKHHLEKKLEEVFQQQANQLKDSLAKKSENKNGFTVIIEKVDLPNADSLKNIAYALRNQFEDLLMILAANVDGKPQVAVMLGSKTEASKKYHAGEMIKILAKEIGGGGGGQPFYATAGGKNLNGLDAVVKKGREMAANG